MSADKICLNCEYFDRFYGDCHNPHSPRFQTEPNWTCPAFFPTTGGKSFGKSMGMKRARAIIADADYPAP